MKLAQAWSRSSTPNESLAIDEIIDVCPNMVRAKLVEWEIKCTKVNTKHRLMHSGEPRNELLL